MVSIGRGVAESPHRWGVVGGGDGLLLESLDQGWGEFDGGVQRHDVSEATGCLA